MASAAVHYNSGPIISNFDTHRSKFEDLADNARGFSDSVLEMAEALLETEGADQTEGAKAAIKELLDSQAEAKAFANAMTATKSSYVPSDRVTNFAQTIDQGTKRLLPVVRNTPEMKEYYSEACSRLEIEDEQEEEEKELGSDDDIQMGCQSGAAPNTTCPLSLKPLMDIEDPVEDQKGYVYERVHVEQYIKQKQAAGVREVQCPASATNHLITIAGLKKAVKVIRLQRKQRIHGTQQQSQVDAIDVD